MGRRAQHVGSACLIARRAWAGCPRPNHTCASKLDKAGQTISIVFLATRATASRSLLFLITSPYRCRHSPRRHPRNRHGFHPARETDPNQPESRHPSIPVALSTSNPPSHRHGERVPSILRSSANLTEFNAQMKERQFSRGCGGT